LALWVYRRLAVPAFILALVAGSAQLLSDLQLYFVTRHYMHAKLPLALAIIAFHHILGGRARRMANGQATSAGPAAKLVGAIVVCAALATYLVKAQPF
jgi:putative membrane protein